jgi:hypothetical protein
MNEQFESKLPVFNATRSEDFPAFLVVFCGYADCPGTAGDRPFLVAEREWLRPRRVISRRTGISTTIVGRSCSYCFRAGRIPSRRAIGAKTSR